MTRALLSAASLVVALAFGIPASAAVADDVRTCVRSLHDIGPVPQSHVKACTLAVNSGELEDRQLAMVLFARATLHARSGDVAEARRDYTQAAMLNRSPGFAAFVKGAVARAEGDPVGTVRALSEALSLSPDSLDMLVWRGDAFYALGALDDALQDYERALRLSPELLVVRLTRGSVLIGLGRAEEAVAALDLFRRQRPDNVPALLALSRARFDVGDILGAVAAADRADALWPRGLVRFNVARLHALVGDTEGALRRLEDASVARDRWLAFEARVLRFLINRETMSSLHADALVAAAHDGDAEAWYRPLAHFLATAFPSPDKHRPPYPAVTIEALVETARASGHEDRAWFYVGEVRRLQGDVEGAKAAFRQVFELGRIDTWEFRQSRQRLRALQ